MIARSSVDGGSAGKRTSQKVKGGKIQNEGGGKFQKTSVDEAYLEPTRRTLMAELLLSQQERNGHSGAAGYSSATTDVAAAPAAAAKLSLAGGKRPRGGENHASEGCPLQVEPSAKQWRYGDDGGSVPSISRYGERPSGSQEEGSSGEGNSWDMALGCDSFNSDGQSDKYARRRKGDRSRTKKEEEEEDQFLEAGGSLGRRIQRTLREVLKYDCSVGVAGNKVRNLRW